MKYIVGDICSFAHGGKHYKSGMEITAAVFGNADDFTAAVKAKKIIAVPDEGIPASGAGAEDEKAKKAAERAARKAEKEAAGAKAAAEKAEKEAAEKATAEAAGAETGTDATGGSEGAESGGGNTEGLFPGADAK